MNNFPFFSNTSMKSNPSKQDLTQKFGKERAKTPALESCNSQQFFEPMSSFSPKGILKKPNTANTGTRKQVHYHMANLLRKRPSLKEINSPKIQNLEESSYFGNTPKTSLRSNARPQSGTTRSHLATKGSRKLRRN